HFAARCGCFCDAGRAWRYCSAILNQSEFDKKNRESKVIRKLTTLTAATAALLGFAGTAAADTWKYAIEEALHEVQGVYATKFKEHIEANSDHEVEIYPFGTLGESADTTELAQLGAIQFVDASPGFTGSLIPELQVFLLPYVLPEDPDVLADFFDTSATINDKLASLYEEKSLKLIDMFPEGEVVMTTKEP